MTDCPPMMEPMDRETMQYGAIEFVTAIAETETRYVEAIYSVEKAGNKLLISGDVNLTNLSDERRIIRYRHRVKLPADWPGAVQPDELYGVCVIDQWATWGQEVTLAPDQSVTLDMDYIVQRRKEEDLNADGKVDNADLSILLANWGSNDPRYDLSGDGTVGSPDVGEILAAWTG